MVPTCLCIYTGERPVWGVHINIPYSNGKLCSQVFELSTVFHHICTIGSCAQARKFVHPITLNKVNRILTLDFIIDCAPKVQAQINEERRRLLNAGRELSILKPLTQEDAIKWRDMYQRVTSIADLPDEFDYADMDLGPVAEGVINPNGGPPIALHEGRRGCGPGGGPTSFPCGDATGFCCGARSRRERTSARRCCHWSH